MDTKTELLLENFGNHQSPGKGYKHLIDLTTKDVANLLGVSTRYVNYLIRSNKLPIKQTKQVLKGGRRITVPDHTANLLALCQFLIERGTVG